MGKLDQRDIELLNQLEAPRHIIPFIRDNSLDRLRRLYSMGYINVSYGYVYIRDPMHDDNVLCDKAEMLYLEILETGEIPEQASVTALAELYIRSLLSVFNYT